MTRRVSLLKVHQRGVTFCSLTLPCLTYRACGRAGRALPEPSGDGYRLGRWWGRRPYPLPERLRAEPRRRAGGDR